MCEYFRLISQNLYNEAPIAAPKFVHGLDAFYSNFRIENDFTGYFTESSC